MAPGVVDRGRVNLPSTLMATRERRVALVIGGGVAVVALTVAVWIRARLFLRGMRIGRRATRFSYSAATFRLYKRCPDCKGLVHADARVCRHCGYRKPPPPPHGRRARQRAERSQTDQAAAPA